MNIFVTNSSPTLSAQALDDVRVNKMILESVQMLTTALQINGLPEAYYPFTKSGKRYKPTHRNHPCTLWASSTKENYSWLLEHLQALLEENKHRSGNTHACWNTLPLLIGGAAHIPSSQLEEFVNCSKHAGLPYRTTERAYQMCMDNKWENDTIKVKWTNRKPPSWISLRVVQIGDVFYKVDEKMMKALNVIISAPSA